MVKCTAGGENVKRVLLTWWGKGVGVEGVLPTHSREHVNTHVEEEERKKNVKALKKNGRPCPFMPEFQMQAEPQLQKFPNICDEPTMC